MAHPRYQGEHPRIRARIQAQLEQGAVIHCTNPKCQHPGVPITAQRGTPLSLQLGHNPDGVTHRGPEHWVCNGSEGGKRGAAIKAQRASTPEVWAW